MHKALFYLGFLRARAALRSLVRGAKRPRGFLYLVIGGFVMGSWLCGSLFGALFTPRRAADTPAWVPLGMPLLLLVYTVSSLLQFRSDRLIFKPAEVDFLFAGPFSRRELLLYKLWGIAIGCAGSALFVSLAFYRHASSIWGLYCGMLLVLLFIQLVQMAISLAGLVLAERTRLWFRVLLVGAVAGLIVAAVTQAPPLPSTPQELPDWWRGITQSPGGRILMAPFQALTNAAIPPNGYPAGLVWLAVAAAIDAGLLLVVLLLDANYLESALVASQRRYELIQRAKQGRRTAAVRSDKRQGRIPALGWWGGAGPTAWRQLTSALRTSRFVVLLPPIVFGIALLLGVYQAEVAIAAVSFGLVYLTLLLMAQVRYDFRGDLDNIPWLKSLPISPLALVVGQLVTPVLLISAVALSALAGLGGSVGSVRHIVAGAATFVVPVALLLFGVENLFFLLFPSRTMALNVGELQSVGRFMVIFACKSLVLMLCIGAALGLGSIAFLVSGQSLVVGGTVAWIALASAALGTLPVVAWAFARFDPGLDMPG